MFKIVSRYEVWLRQTRRDSTAIISKFFDFSIGYLTPLSTWSISRGHHYLFLNCCFWENQFLQSLWSVLQKAEGSLFSNEMWTAGLYNIVQVSFSYYFHKL